MSKIYLLLIITIPLLTSCDYWADHTYTVTNNSDSIITIKTDISRSYDFIVNDSISIIRPNESIKIIEELGALCGRNEIPESWYTENDTIPLCKKFDIYAGGTLVSKKLRLLFLLVAEAGA